MMVHEQDPDVVRWGLHNLIDVCAIRSNGSCSGVTQYEADRGQVGYVSEFYNEPVYTNNIESDAVIARALQEELSHVAAAEASGRLDAGQDSIIAQDWRTPSGTWKSYGDDDNRNKTGIPHSMQNEPDGFSDNKKAEESDQVQVSASPSSGQQNYPSMEDVSCDIDIADEHEEYALDGEVGKRINQMVPIPHVPKINGDIPTLDEEVSDHQRLLDRLKVYFLVENKIQGDGNCQFRALSDQLYRSSDYHKFVRQQVVDQLTCSVKSFPSTIIHPYVYLLSIDKLGLENGVIMSRCKLLQIHMA
ncbi:OVARIAN TUMOR DOMAIN-containing deubiquitinating enzyme 9 [Linum grandiflorum]